jgi:hypothetical protein
MSVVAVPNIRQACYAVPTRYDMAVLMVMFNPTSSVRIQMNWMFVWNKLAAAGIPVFGCELLFPWQRPSLAPSFKTISVRSDSIMFHKEKLLARLEKEVPAQFTKLCAIDCDVVFQKPDWYDMVSQALDERPMVQPYSRCHWMGPDLRAAVMTNPSAASKLDAIRQAHAGGGTDRLTGHPGFAMAMRRTCVGQFPWAVCGGGDAVLFRAANGLVGEFANRDMKRLMSAAWTSWSPGALIDGDVGSVAGDIWHMWHGPLKSRNYYDRYEKFVEALKPHDVRDIRDILVENADGVWNWRADVKKDLNAMMMRYFASRDDDSVQ